jgi:V8-like Glu-specific endopeptidase
LDAELESNTLLMLLLCITAPRILSSQNDLTQLVNQVRPSVVTVVGFNGDGKPIAQGTGFFVASNGTLITNYHVLAEAQKASIKTRSGKVYDIVETIAEDIDGDLIAVRANIQEFVVQPLRISRTKVLLGQRIVVIGSPFGLEQSVSDGIVSAVRQSDDLGRIIQITAPISPGSSGSPVTRTNGEVVGVASLYLRNGQNLNFAIPSERITALLSHGINPARGATRGNRVLQARASKEKTKEETFDKLFAEFFEEERRSIPTLEERIRKNPGDIEAYESLDDAYMRLGKLYERGTRTAEAISIYRQAIKMNPKNADAYLNLGLLYLSTGDRRSTLDIYESLKKIDPAKAKQLSGAIYQ